MSAIASPRQAILKTMLKTEKKLASKVPMLLIECNARNDYDLGMSAGNVWRTLVRFTYTIPKFMF
jgi:hypothetical protein